MASTILRINPFDTFFFRDGKPFTMGDDSWADGIFPPSPSVIYGALRTAWISEQATGFTPDNVKASEALKIKGIFVEFTSNALNTIALPVPRDFVYEKGNETNKVFLNFETKKVISKKSPEMVALPPNELLVENFDKKEVLEKDNFQKYLSGNKKITHKKNYLKQESKIGIGRNFDTHTTAEGSLYRVDMYRFEANYLNDNKGNDTTASIVVECEGLEFPNKSILKIGGEGKAAQCEKINNTQYCEITAPTVLQNHRFRLCLVTPSVFDNGWLPNWIDQTSFIGEYKIEEYKSVKLKLLGTVLGKPVSLGGFGYSQITQRFEPKIMYKAIPAGSVYYFEILQGTLDDIKTLFHYKSISEQKANEGFGITYIGV